MTDMTGSRIWPLALLGWLAAVPAATRSGEAAGAAPQETRTAPSMEQNRAAPLSRYSDSGTGPAAPRRERKG